MRHMRIFRGSRKLRMKLVGMVLLNCGLERAFYPIAMPGPLCCTLRKLPLEKIGLKGPFWRYTPFVLDRSTELIHIFNMPSSHPERSRHQELQPPVPTDVEPAQT